MKTVCIVQARMGSKRLPGKVLFPLNGHTVIGEVLTRCKQIPGVDEVVCAIPEDDEELGNEAAKYANLYLGSEDDVLHRYANAAITYKADLVVRVTGDCPHISPELCGDVLGALKRENAHYSSNVLPRTFPKGLDCEAFTAKALARCHDIMSPTEQYMREHVTPLLQQSEKFRRVNVVSPWPMDGRLTLDTEDDYKVICAAFGHEPYQHLRAA